MTEYPNFNTFAPTPCTCKSECEGACAKLSPYYVVEFSELPWGLDTTWVFPAVSKTGYNGMWYPDETFPDVVDGETADPDGEMDGLCLGYAYAVAYGTTELCHIRYWRRVMTGGGNDVQCGIMKYTRVMNVIAWAKLVIGNNYTDPRCPQTLRARVYLGVCFSNSGNSCEYDPNTSEGDASWVQMVDLQLGADWSCENLPTPMSDYCEWGGNLPGDWEELPEMCLAFTDDGPFGYSEWTTTTDFRVYGMWIKDIPNCTNFDVDGGVLTDSDYQYDDTWCDDTPEFTHELASGTTVRIYTSPAFPD